MIFKVQRPLLTNEPVPRVLVYNKSQKVCFQADLKPWKKLMGKELKIFVHGEIKKDGSFEVQRRANWQKW